MEGCCGDVEPQLRGFNDMCRRFGGKRLVLTRGVERKWKEGTMTMTTHKEDVSNNCQSSGPMGMSEGGMAPSVRATWLGEVGSRTCIM